MRYLYKLLLLLLCMVSFYFVCDAKEIDSYYLYNTSNNVIVNAKNAIMYNLNDNKILYEDSSRDKISIASLTKIMTAIVVIDSVDDLDESVIITKDALFDLDGYATVGFKVGDKVTYRDLLYATILPSAADAAQALAISYSDSYDEFSILMNEKAKELELSDSHFSNPVGRDDDGNYSTVYDVSKLLLYALSNQTFYDIYTSSSYRMSNGMVVYSTLKKNSLKYGIDVSNYLGAKTGYTDNAGLCLASLYEKDGIRYLLVIANSLYQNGYPNHLVDSSRIYDYYSSNYGYRDVVKKDVLMYSLDVYDAYKKKYDIVNDSDISLYINNDYDLNNIRFVYDGIDKITYKNKYNQKLGIISVMYDDDILYVYDVYLNEKIRFRYTNFVVIFVIIVLFVCFVLFKIKRRRKIFYEKSIKR